MVAPEYLNIALIFGGAILGGWLGAERRMARLNGGMDMLGERLKHEQRQRTELSDIILRCQISRDLDHKEMFARIGTMEKDMSKLEGQLGGKA